MMHNYSEICITGLHLIYDFIKQKVAQHIMTSRALSSKPK